MTDELGLAAQSKSDGLNGAHALKVHITQSLTYYALRIMAVGRLSRVLVVFILLALTLSSFRVKAVEAVLDRKANILLVVSGFDIKQFPTRNSVRARFYLRETRVSPSLKCAVGIRLVNIATCASCLVLLAGDVMENPGPVKDPCAVCTNGCRRNQKSIQSVRFV